MALLLPEGRADAQPTAFDSPTTDPRETEIFGITADAAASQPSGKQSAPAQGNNDAASSPADQRDQAILGDSAGGAPDSHADPRTPLESPTPDLEGRLLALGTDRLQIGGLMLLRFNWSFTDSDRLEQHEISLPNLLDVYLDARPTERLRAFVRGRLLWDPSIDEGANAQNRAALEQAREQGLDPGLVELLDTAIGPDQTTVQLNELWLKFDIARRLFVTIGQQLVRWGASRLWNPTDVINRSRRPVLSPFDQRNGAPLLRLHLPVESLGWNFYAIGLLDQLSSLDRAGLVGRAEFVISTVELGLVAAYRDNVDPVIGMDWSAGLWDFDLTGELALTVDDTDTAAGVTLQTSAGLAYNLSVFDDDILVCGGEYFYNQRGTSETNALELVSGQRQFFYAGRHYLALFATLPRPGRLDDWTFTLSAVGNLSDRSFLTRFDLSVRLLTYLTLQAFIVAHLGEQGELRIGDRLLDPAVRTAARALFNPDDPTTPLPTQVVDLGLWLSLDL